MSGVRLLSAVAASPSAVSRSILAAVVETAAAATSGAPNSAFSQPMATASPARSSRQDSAGRLAVIAACARASVGVVCPAGPSTRTTAAIAMVMASSVTTVSAPLATDRSARCSVTRRISPKKPAAASIIHIGKAGERQIWSSDEAHAQFMRDGPSREQRANGQSEHRESAAAPGPPFEGEAGLLTAAEYKFPGTRQCAGSVGLQDSASWLSWATRSKASVELLIRYWQSSPSVGSKRMISYEPLAAGRATLLAVNNTRDPIGNLCFNTLSITQTTPATPMVPLRWPAGNPAAV